MNGVAKTTGSRFGSVFAKATASPLKTIGATMVGLFAIQKVKDFFQGAIAEARESQKVSALTAQVIKSTGGAAGVSAKQVGDLANQISLMTGIDDEAVQGAENLLLTFTNLRNEAGKGNDVFNQATKIVTDMSVALDQDLKSSSIQVGKALNDPIKGLTALTRVGVAFTDQQKEQITTLTESGHRLQAQKIILGELNKEFGGAAAAAATSGDKFKVAFANLQEQVGLALLPVLDKLLNEGTVLITWLMTKVPPAFAAAKAAIAPLVAVIDDFVSNHLTAFKTALAALGGSAIASVIALLGGGLVTALVTLVGALTAPVALIGALVAAAIYAYTHFTGFRAAVDSLAASLRSNFGPVVASAAAFITGTLTPALLRLGNYVRANVLPALQQFGHFLASQVIPIIAQLAQFMVGRFYPAMIKIWSTVAQKLKPTFDQLVATFRGSVLPTLTQAAAKFREWWPTIQKVIEVVVKLYGKFLIFEATVAGKVLPVIIKFAGFVLGKMVPATIAQISATAKIIAKLIEFGKAVVDRIQEVVRFAQAIKGHLGSAATTAVSAFNRIVGALSPLGAAFSAVTSAVHALISAIQSIPSHINVPHISMPNIPGLPKVAIGSGLTDRSVFASGEYAPTSSLTSSDTAVLTELRALRRAVEPLGDDFGRRLAGVAANGRRRSIA